jgi:hypothetical protein
MAEKDLEAGLDARARDNSTSRGTLYDKEATGDGPPDSLGSNHYEKQKRNLDEKLWKDGEDNSDEPDVGIENQEVSSPSPKSLKN